MQDIEALTDRVILIGKGQKLYDGSLKELRKKYSNKKYTSIEMVMAKVYKELNIA
jgi:ABC-2 type transport system ATP-binding protein